MPVSIYGALKTPVGRAKGDLFFLGFANGCYLDLWEFFIKKNFGEIIKSVEICIQKIN